MGPNRSCAVVANNGRKRVCSIETAGREMDYSGSAKNARASVSNARDKLGERISDMRTVAGWLMGSSRSFAASANDGRTRLGFTKIVREKTA